METVSIRNPGMYWDIAANIYLPPNFDAGKRYPAVVSDHPIGNCKEQTTGNVYGEACIDSSVSAKVKPLRRMPKLAFSYSAPDVGADGCRSRSGHRSRGRRA